ncbi:MAG: isopentenyl phosphate kinase [Anaerolineae bacterium]|jgi:isopentenyl phosphate kinase
MLQFVKLGGSLITDKREAYTARVGVIARLAEEVRAALDSNPELRLLIGHGSGSFGHWAAEPYGTREGVNTLAEWRGYAHVAAAAARLNRLVVDGFLTAGVPVLSLQPSASARCHEGRVVHLETRPIHAALAQRLVPFVYGDVALDDVRGGTIASTEDLFVYLADELRPKRVLLLGRVPGVLDVAGELISHITPADLPRLSKALAGSPGVDVTGGMADKVARVVGLVARHTETSVQIMTGMEPGLLTRALLDETLQVGTRIEAVGRQEEAEPGRGAS